MERASKAFVAAFLNAFSTTRPVYIIAGKGNNGGDGLAISRLLAEEGYMVQVLALSLSGSPSEDFQANWNRLPTEKLLSIETIEHADQLPKFPDKAIVVDAMLGSGLDRPLKGLIADIVKAINKVKCTKVAVDIPTGVYCDELNPDPVKVQASYTFTFQLPKLTFMLPETKPFVGKFQVIPIGLSQDFIAGVNAHHSYLTADKTSALLRARSPFQHKGNFGHALILAGAYGTIGAAQVTANGALRAGLGLLTLAIPSCGYDPLQTSVPEAMLKPDTEKTHLTRLPDLSAYNSIGIGPGIGQEEETATVFEHLLQGVDEPVVIDADALNLLSQYTHLWNHLPAKSILTPHPGEFDRLAGKHETSIERLNTARNIAADYQVNIVLKGGHTAIADPSGHISFNTTGNPGMGTAGSGDTLTGILTGLLAQGYTPHTSAKIGVYWHGLAGDLAAEKIEPECLLARDILANLPEALRQMKAFKSDEF